MRWDAIVVGGGPAGSAAAIRLAQAGRNVLLLEKTVTAHHKVCGEFVSIEARHLLEQLNFDCTSAGAVAIGHIRLAKGKAVVRAALPFQGLSLSREKLDEALLALAVNAGVTVKRGRAVKGMRYQDGGWRVSTPDNDYVAHNVFLASGKHDVGGFNRSGGLQNDFIGFKSHFILSQEQAAGLAGHSELVLFNGGYAGLEMNESGKANLCMVISKTHFLSLDKSWQGLLTHLTQSTPWLAARLLGAQAVFGQPLSIYRIPYGFVYRDSADAPPGLYRIGDQMAVIPSFCGDGIAIALRTAFLATQHYLQEGSQAYHRHAHALLFPQIRFASRLSRILAVPALQSGLLGLCRIIPGLIPAMARRTRLADFCN